MKDGNAVSTLGPNMDELLAELRQAKVDEQNADVALTQSRAVHMAAQDAWNEARERVQKAIAAVARAA